MGVPADGVEVMSAASMAWLPAHVIVVQGTWPICSTMSFSPAAIAFADRAPADAPRSVPWGIITIKAKPSQNADRKRNMEPTTLCNAVICPALYPKARRAILRRDAANR
jgi:hypothetical protein